MTIQEKLNEEFGAAIIAIYGDNKDKDIEDFEITEDDIRAIYKKVIFYLFK